MQKKWIYSYGELVGKSHAPRKIPCQDKALCRDGNGVHVAVVSDGCGSSDISQHGSLVTTEVLCNLFIDRFDELYDEEILATRQIIVNEIVAGLKKFISKKTSLFKEYRVSHKEKYQRFIQGRTEEEFDLDCLNATALFVAEKDGKFIIGQIGDGIIGAVIDRKLKIIMEEKKDGEINGTIYPGNIYTLAQEDPRWYATSRFQLKKPKNANLQGFILMSDGVDGLIDQRVAFQKKFAAGTGKLIKNTVKSESFEEAQKALNEELLPRLVEFSKARDDCSVSLLIQDDCEVDDNGYVITYYERPTTKGEEDIEEFDENFRIDDLELDAPKTAEEIKLEKEKEAKFEKQCQTLLEDIKQRISDEDAADFAKKAAYYFQAQSKAKLNEILEFYLDVLDGITEQKFYVLDRNEKKYRNLTYIYQFDNKIVKLPGGKITRREEDETKAKDSVVR